MDAKRMRIRVELLVIGLVLILATLGCSLADRLTHRTNKEWSISLSRLQDLFDQANQGMSEPDRILHTIDRVRLGESGGLTLTGACQTDNGTTQDVELAVALSTLDSRVRLEVSPAEACGIARDDPRLARLNDLLSNAVNEKIAHDCGKILVNWIELSGGRLRVQYVNQ